MRRAIRTAESLGLLTVAGEDGPCRLAADGEDALRQDRFNAVLAKVALRRLEALGYASDALPREMKAIQLPELPDLPTLYARRPPAANGFEQGRFRQADDAGRRVWDVSRGHGAALLRRLGCGAPAAHHTVARLR